MALDIKVGQQWKTRNGTILRVTKDRGEGDRWRWALSNSEIADADGRIAFTPGMPHRHDLIELTGYSAPMPLMQRDVDAMDSTMGGI